MPTGTPLLVEFASGIHCGETLTGAAFAFVGLHVRFSFESAAGILHKVRLICNAHVTLIIDEQFMITNSRAHAHHYHVHLNSLTGIGLCTTNLETLLFGHCSSGIAPCPAYLEHFGQLLRVLGHLLCFGTALSKNRAFSSLQVRRLQEKDQFPLRPPLKAPNSHHSILCPNFRN